LFFEGIVEIKAINIDDCFTHLIHKKAKATFRWPAPSRRSNWGCM